MQDMLQCWQAFVASYATRLLQYCLSSPAILPVLTACHSERTRERATQGGAGGALPRKIKGGAHRCD
jgi:hypothetical protein